MSSKTTGISIKTLRLPVKAVYFHQIATGGKSEEFRLQTDYWRKRLEDQQYDRVEILLGYWLRPLLGLLVLMALQGCSTKSLRDNKTQPDANVESEFRYACL